jgi:outer membrane protein, multidrug efflux system
VKSNLLRSMSLLAAIAAATGCATLPQDHKPLRQRDQSVDDIERNASIPAGAWPDTAWWKRYNDPQLDTLIERALTDAPSMETAQARVYLAQQSTQAADAARGAKVDLDTSITREKLPSFGLIPPPYGGQTISDAEAKVGFSYDFDWWGKNRATLAAATSDERAAQADRAAAALILTSAIVQRYSMWQALDARIVLADETLKQYEQLIHLLQARVAHGLESSAIVDTTKSHRDSFRQNISALAMNQRIAAEQLRALLGAAPGTLPDLNPVPLPSDDAGVPAQLGLDLLSRRPDIEASRLRIQAQTHRIDAAKAEFYPDINLSAFVGLSSVVMSRFLNSDSLTAGVTPALHLPLFDAGRLRANLGVTRANLDVAIASYNQTVIDAASDVAVQATTLSGLAEQRRAISDSLTAENAVEANAQLRMHQGISDARDIINAEMTVLAQRDVLLQIDAERLQTQVALIKALGGGYRSESDNANVTSTNTTPTTEPRHVQ